MNDHSNAAGTGGKAGEKVLLIDGYSILNRAFYGVPRLSNSKGVPTNAVYGFLNILFKLTDAEAPAFGAVAFDLKAPTFRHKMYDGYKGTRKPMPDELHAQVPVIQEILKTMGIPSVSCESYEADDVLGTLAKRCEKEGMQVMILSGDRDILQLVTENITVRLPKTAKGVTTIENYTPEKIKEVYGITPLQIIDLKAMMGDSSDNIPGLPGVGEKTALNLLDAYGSLENAKEHAEEIKPKKAMEAFRDHYDLGVLSKELATIITDAPVSIDIDELKLGNFFNPEAFALFKEYEFKNLYPRFLQDASEAQERKEIRLTEDAAGADAVFEKAGQNPGFGFCADITEEGLAGVALSCGGELFYLKSSNEMNEGYFTEKINRLLEKTDFAAVCDLKEALKALSLTESEKLFDVLIAAYLLDPLKSDYPYE